MAYSETQKKFNEQRESILRKGEPPLTVNGKPNTAWVTWYRAFKHVTTNVAKGQLKKRIEAV